MTPMSLSRRLALLISLGFAMIWVLSMAVTGVILRGEQTELFDNELVEIAGLFRPIVTQALTNGLVDSDAIDAALKARGTGDPDEVLIYQVLKNDGTVLINSRDFAQAEPPSGAIVSGFDRTANHMFYTSEFNTSGLAVRVGDPLMERREAFLDSFIAFLIPMFALLPLAYFLVRWVARTALAPLDQLRDDISARGDGQLAPIDAAGQPMELAAITASLNGLMTRLSQSLEGERAFASSAAHELRTPLAVALAQVQRLRAETPDPAGQAAIVKVEDALKRMVRLVARLLQMARAEAGIGVSGARVDVAKLLQFSVDDVKRDPARKDRLKIDLTDQPVFSVMDADAFAIVVGNLVDNAFQHGTPDGEVHVLLSQDGYVSVSNESAVIAPESLSKLIERLHQGSTVQGGFGLGLYIADRIVRQAGSALELRSPAAGQTDGFMAGFVVPPANRS